MIGGKSVKNYGNSVKEGDMLEMRLDTQSGVTHFGLNGVALGEAFIIKDNLALYFVVAAVSGGTQNKVFSIKIESIERHQLG
mmetsp:Transcript_13087/g.6440  ORF Transcript_13087/g.6440 Transcript_13087/m.6440 type:complete len:82 (-) Transcript_13087:57-302(-)